MPASSAAPPRSPESGRWGSGAGASARWPRNANSEGAVERNKFQPTHLVYCSGLGGDNLLGKEGPVPAVLGRGQSVQREAAGAPLVPSLGAVGRPCPPPGAAGGSASSAQLLLLSFPLFFSFSFSHPPSPSFVFFFPKLPAEFYQQMFSKACLGPQSRVQKCQRAERSWGVRLSEQLQKQVPVLGHLRSWHGFRSPTGQSAKLFCVHASELPSWDIVRGGFVGIGP